MKISCFLHFLFLISPEESSTNNPIALIYAVLIQQMFFHARDSMGRAVLHDAFL
jgi:hypothetical protein